MEWVGLMARACTFAALAGCNKEPPPCNTCTEAGSPCAIEDATAYGWLTCGATQSFRTCTCSGGAWDCGDCPDAGGAD